MNPEVSPWMLIADRQRMSDFRREQEERELKSMIRVKYQRQLQEQIKEKQNSRAKQKHVEKQWQKGLINASLQNQQRVIQLEMLKAYASNERHNKLDVENQQYKQAKRQREMFIQSETRRIQNQQHNQVEQKQRRQYEEQERRKKMLRDNLKQSIDVKETRNKVIKQKQNQFEIKKLREHEMLAEREDQFREEYLRRLKQRASTIDYGSHEAFQVNHQKSLIQRKRDEWRNDQQYFKRANQLQMYEQESRRRRQNMQQSYKSQIQRQISEREELKRYNNRRQQQSDYQTMMRYQNFSKSLDARKRETNEQNKKQLQDYLQRQVEEKQRQSKEIHQMRNMELQMNMELLANSRGIIPGETYELDPSRKKQLETVAKSVGGSSGNSYFAERGRTIVH